jgi:hypothetical protein
MQKGEEKVLNLKILVKQYPYRYRYINYGVNRLTKILLMLRKETSDTGVRILSR